MGQNSRAYLRRPSIRDVEVVARHSLPYLLASPDDAFLVVLDPGGRAPELPVRTSLSLRLRFHASEGQEYVPPHALAPFDRRHAEHVLRFLTRVRRCCTRIVVCSPDGEIRGPGLALGVADILRLPVARITALEEWYRWHSRAVRRILWQTAYPPQPVATRPEVKAASGILAFLSRYFSG